MKYHAILRGVDGLDRVRQDYTNTLPAIEQWAKRTLDTVMGSDKITDEQRVDPRVEVFEIREVPVKVVRP